VVKQGVLVGVGVGPGDPDLVTVKAARLLGKAEVVAYFCKKGTAGRAFPSAEPHLSADAKHLAFPYPVTTEHPVSDVRYADPMTAFYDDCAANVARELEAGRDVALICEGDPFFYGSFMHVYLRLKDAYTTQCIAGITGMSGCWSAAMTPMTFGDDVLTVLPGTLEREALIEKLKTTDAAVVMKIGSNFRKVKQALADSGRLDEAIYVERGSHQDQVIERLAKEDRVEAPYFSIILVPGRGRRF
jgi:precorrin-2/cobalt-factor-2 C20-methyltransferase